MTRPTPHRGKRHHGKRLGIRRRRTPTPQDSRPDAAALWLRGDEAWKPAAEEINPAALIERRRYERQR
jgi:hypothetical protein